MKRPPRGPETEPLFDLPLNGEAGDAGTPAANAPASGGELAQPDLPLEIEVDPAAMEAHTASSATTGGPEGPEPPGPGLTTFGRRLVGGGLDILAHLVALILAVGGCWWLDVPPNRLTALPLALFSAGFSFIYHVLPLVFWGQTPGMAKFDLVARSLDGGPLTMGQAVRRWLGALLSVATLGLFLVFGTKRTLADRLSGSTVRA